MIDQNTEYRFIHERDSTTIRYWWVCEIVPAGFAAGRRRLGRAVVVVLQSRHRQHFRSIAFSHLSHFSGGARWRWQRLHRARRHRGRGDAAAHCSVRLDLCRLQAIISSTPGTERGNRNGLTDGLVDTEY